IMMRAPSWSEHMPRRQRLIRERAKRLQREIDRNEYVARTPNGAPLRNQLRGHARDLARMYTEVSVETLYILMTKSKTDSIRLLAASTMLERGWGKPGQAITGPDGEGEAVVRHVHEVKRTLVRAEKPAADNENGKLRPEVSPTRRILR